MARERWNEIDKEISLGRQVRDLNKQIEIHGDAIAVA